MKNFKLILRSLISNDAAIEGGRKKPWYFAIIMVFISLIICLVPSLVSSLNKNGSDFITGSYTYGYELGLRRFVEDITENDFDMTINESESGRFLDVTQDAWDNKFTSTNTYGLHRFYHMNADEKIDFEVYFVDGTISSEFQDHVTNTKNEDETVSKKANSYIIFGKYSWITGLFSLNSTTAKTTYYGDYKSMEVGFNFKKLGEVKLDDQTILTPTTVDKTNAKQYETYIDGVFNNYKEFLNVGYQHNKITSLWQTLLIMFGINVGLTLFMGLMVFLLTRGKNNPFRIYTFWESQKIVYWCSVAPAVLSIAVGFMMSTFAQVAFPMLLGLRIMWLSMRSLRPENATAETTEPVKSTKTVNVKPVKK